MSRRNTEIKYIEGSTTYRPMPYGRFSGSPVVSLKLSSSETNAIKVNSLERMFENRGWKKKLNSGFARLHIYGDNPLSDEHIESLGYLFDVLDPRFVDIEIDADVLDNEPPRIIDQKADTYTVVFDVDNDEELVPNPDALKYITDRGRNYGDTQYIFKTNTVMCEDTVNDFSFEYNVYDSDIWLYPKGRKVGTTAEKARSLESVAKRNTWNLSPRMDLLSDYSEKE